jgi:hypothetical protein
MTILRIFSVSYLGAMSYGRANLLARSYQQHDGLGLGYFYWAALSLPHYSAS